jgi:CBS domain containing-hemolysin-like protein
MLLGAAGMAIVLDKRGGLDGVLNIDDIITAIQTMQDAAVEYYRTAKLIDPSLEGMD